jgi:hypothetical protein
MTSLLDPLVAAFRRAMDERNDCNKPLRAERQFMPTYAKGGVCSSTRGLELDESLLDVEMVCIEGEARSLDQAHPRSRPLREAACSMDAENGDELKC